MAQARWGHTATVLSDGSVLVAGGTGPALDGTYTVRAEIYHPGSNRWRSVDPMATARGFHIASRLADGSVLVAGGLTHPHHTVNVTGASEFFDPATERWKPTGNLSVARGAGPHGAALLLDGRFLVAGGRTFTAEIYNPATAQWQFTGSMSISRSSHTLTLLGNGDVLAVGGENINGIISNRRAIQSWPVSPWRIPAQPGTTGLDALSMVGRVGEDTRRYGVPISLRRVGFAPR
jgi:N-acetylneuraminic acid mutarotase